MPLPLIIWGGVAAVTFVVGGVATLAVTDTVDDFGRAAEKTTNLVNSVSRVALWGAAGYLAWENRDLIASAANKVLK
ncbi:hypothetical protein [Kordiimonas aquimaris]|uniref:hypothetical protein n=1 Tax=Kordiimonas aquimaris TaxID=707591 RepID=UPI0021D3E4C2|nr:hypothetical protein [Kordiimonas aquimaris]